MKVNNDMIQSSYGKYIVCPWCQGDEITSRTIKDFKGDCETKVDLCRCADCGRTFSVTKE